jgi:hypothetical protein
VTIGCGLPVFRRGRTVLLVATVLVALVGCGRGAGPAPRPSGGATSAGTSPIVFEQGGRAAAELEQALASPATRLLCASRDAHAIMLESRGRGGVGGFIVAEAGPPTTYAVLRAVFGAMSPDARWVMTATSDGEATTIHVYRLPGGAERWAQAVPRGCLLWSLVPSPDSRRLAVDLQCRGFTRRRVDVYDLVAGTRLGSLECPLDLQRRVAHLSWSDGSDAMFFHDAQGGLWRGDALTWQVSSMGGVPSGAPLQVTGARCLLRASPDGKAWAYRAGVAGGAESEAAGPLALHVLWLPSAEHDAVDVAGPEATSEPQWSAGKLLFLGESRADRPPSLESMDPETGQVTTVASGVTSFAPVADGVVALRLPEHRNTSEVGVVTSSGEYRPWLADGGVE